MFSRIRLRSLLLVALLSLSFPAADAAAQMRDAAARGTQGTHFVYLVRHGIYDRDSTVTNDVLGNGLNALGHEQARLTGARLAALQVRVSRVVTSDYRRARETAADIGVALGMPVTQDSLLRECTPTSDRPDYRRGLSDAELFLCDSTLAAAYAKYLRPTPEADTRDVLVCHGNVIRRFLVRALGMDLASWTHMDIGNCSITVLAVRPDGGVRLVAYSDTGHLPADKQTWSGRGAGWTPAKK